MKRGRGREDSGKGTGEGGKAEREKLGKRGNSQKQKMRGGREI